jgi:hypothetical protein
VTRKPGRGEGLKGSGPGEMPRRDEIPWGGEGPDPRGGKKGPRPAVETFRFTEGRARVPDSERGAFDVQVLDGEAVPWGSYLLPARFRIEPRLGRRPSNLPAIEVEVIDGRPRCYGISAQAEHLTGALLRDLPIDTYIREAIWRLARTKSRRKLAPGTWTLDRINKDIAARALKRRGPGVRLDPDLLQQVADVWKAADRAGENTTLAVASALHCAISTANRWIKRCRDIELIPPPRGRKETDGR